MRGFKKCLGNVKFPRYKMKRETQAVPYIKRVLPSVATYTFHNFTFNSFHVYRSPLKLVWEKDELKIGNWCSQDTLSPLVLE